MEDRFENIEKEVLAGKTDASEEHKEMDHLIKGIQSHFEREELFQKMNTVHDNLESKTKPPRIFRLNNIMKIAASILLIAVMGLVLKNQLQRSGKDIYAQHYETYPNLMLTRSDNSESLIQQAGLAYSQNNYSKTYEILESVDTPMASFYRAVCLMELEEFEEAEKAWVEHLDKYDYLSNQSRYYLALTYVSLGKNKLALNTLRNKINDESYSKKIDQLIDQIE